jgi:hypothetical protein
MCGRTKSIKEALTPMRMRTILSTSGLAAVMAIGLGATTALATAATTWTIKPGGLYTAKSGTTTLTDTATGAVLSCTSSAAAGKLKSGSGKTNPIGTVTSASFTGCTGLGGAATFSVKASASSTKPWKVNATGFSAGVATGNISGIHAVLTGTNNTCKATVDGTGASAFNGKVSIKHSNSAATKLRVVKGINLHVYNVNTTGCLGALNNGDPVTYKATYTLNKAQTITSP